MSQTDVLEFLHEQYKKDSKRWFTSKEVREGLIKNGCVNGSIKGVPRSLFKLALFNEIQCRAVGLLDQHKEFKAYSNTRKCN
jgi:hypothetical protein